VYSTSRDKKVIVIDAKAIKATIICSRAIFEVKDGPRGPHFCKTVVESDSCCLICVSNALKNSPNDGMYAPVAATPKKNECRN